jgi:hypothetical protein
MFGFGVNKFVVLVVLIVAVWYAFKYVGRVEEVRRTLKRARDAAERARAQQRGEARLQAEDMVKCRVCDAYVAASGAGKCGRSDCPW